MAIRLPSKNVLTVLAACLIILGGIALAKHISAPRSSGIAGNSSGDTATFSLVEKALLAAAEAQAGISDTSTSTGNGSATSTGKALTATERFSQALMTEYLVARQQKGTLTDSDKAAIVQTLLRTPLGAPQARRYVRKDIQIISDPSAAALRAYGNSLIQAFEANISPNVGREIYLVQDVLESRSPASVKKLTDLAGYYKRMIAATLKIKTPDIAAGTMVDYLNSLSLLENSIEEMSRVLDDPILAVKGINQREAYANAAITNLETIGTILRQHGIVYGAKELGHEMQPQ